MKKVILMLALILTSGLCEAQDLRQQVEKGIQQSQREADARQWREAFVTLRNLDGSLGAMNPELHYLVSKQRFRLYYRINKPNEVKNNLEAMESYARRSGDAKVMEDMLLVKAAYFQQNGNQPVALQCYRQMFEQRAKGKDDNGKDKCFQQMLAEAKSSKNPARVSLMEKMYAQWQDSIATARAASELKNLKVQYQEAQEDIEGKATTISSQWVTIMFLFILACALGAALAFFVFVMFRNVRTIKNLRTSLKLANRNNEQKSQFIRNIGSLVGPSLDAIENGNQKVHIPALRTMLADVEEYMALESGREEKYEVRDVNVSVLCEQVASRSTGGVQVTVDAPKIKFALNDEATDLLLTKVINEVSGVKETERITLEFKKRNPHTGHFIITAIGMMLSEEEQSKLFTAFAQVYDITDTNGMALPTCALMAYKMGGLLRLDSEFRKGTRFVLELHC